MRDEGVLDPSTIPSEAAEPLVAPWGEAERARPRPRRRARSWVLLLIAVAVGSVLVRAYVVQTFYIPSGSMEPTLWPGQGIVVDKLAAEFGTIHTGDVIVFRASPAVAQDCAEATPDLVKRVIGLPGQTLYSEGNTIYVNYRPLAQPWPHSGPLEPAIGAPQSPIVVPRGQYFVLGDNEATSCDSRYWGFVPRSAIIGKVAWRVWPLSAIGGV